MATRKLAFVRKDLLGNYGIPIGEIYYWDSKPLNYRWRNNDVIFEVLLNGKWQEAQSIDWDFSTDNICSDTIKF